MLASGHPDPGFGLGAAAFGRGASDSPDFPGASAHQGGASDDGVATSGPRSYVSVESLPDSDDFLTCSNAG